MRRSLLRFCCIAGEESQDSQRESRRTARPDSIGHRPCALSADFIGVQRFAGTTWLSRLKTLPRLLPRLRIRLYLVNVSDINDAFVPALPMADGEVGLMQDRCMRRALTLEDGRPEQPSALPSPQPQAGHIRRALSDPQELQQLGLLLAAWLLGPDPGGPQWLGGLLSRLRGCNSLQDLVAELCGALADNVRRRFMVEAAVSAAMVPAQDVAVGLMLRPWGAPPQAASAGQSGPPPQPPSRVGPARQPSAASTSYVALAATGRAGSLPQACEPGSPQSAVRILATVRAAGLSVVAAEPSATTQGDGTGSIPGAALHSARTPAGRSRVVPLLASADMVAAPEPSQGEAGAGDRSIGPAGGLRAHAFPLHHTLLAAVLAAQRQRQGQGQGQRLAEDGQRAPQQVGLNRSAGLATPAAATPQSLLGVLQDVRDYMQGAHNPCDDVCCLMVQAPQPVGGDEGVASALAPVPAPALVGSLVLLPLLLDEGTALGLYVRFPQQLPEPLLEAVRESCAELLEVALLEPLRNKLSGPLAAEYDTLRSAVPGSYAVLHDTSDQQDLVSGQPTPQPTMQLTPEAATTSRLAQSLQSSAFGRQMSMSDLEVLQRRKAGASPRLRRTQQLNTANSCATHAGGEDGSAGTTGASLVARSSSDASLLFSSADAQQRNAMLLNSASSIITVTARTSAGGNMRRRLAVLMGSVGASLGAAVAEAGASRYKGLAAREAVGRKDDGPSQLYPHFPARMTAYPEDLAMLELGDELGRGGAGVVLRGWMATLEVAVKLVEVVEAVGVASGSSRQAREDQLRVRRELLRSAIEMVVQSNVSHPQIVQVYSVFHAVRLTRLACGSLRLGCATGAGGEMDGSAAPAASVPSEGGEVAHAREAALQLLLRAVRGHGGLIRRLDGDPASRARAGGVALHMTAIVCELCELGSLADVISRRDFPRRMRAPTGLVLDMKDVYMTLLDVALALRHLHALNLVHRDVKPANLLLKSSPRDHRRFTAKLADFGFVLRLTHVAEDGSRYAVPEQTCGTPTHMAPECIPRSRTRHTGDGRIGTAVDIYAFGILMWECVAGGDRPFPEIKAEKIMYFVLRGMRPRFAADVPLWYRDIAQACWSEEPRQRPTAADLVVALSEHLGGRA
ncbi:putative LIM domain-containing serine/threonine-protein kinase [Tetrabaena socialis]|uniref:Putative LIM domain-containing serine/threonine-protein kinase n=1 Tax=Tetrabaena socialis TaxID=47790 RepID=A0A2J8AJC2_9CHLO|nr:putative LIM domain-containing serine/threonine-protein kinase [Tetrabaena socialis]|eukprot:PNH12603.1 putative LIM domain-containing serine/threonine-protein kinase [Tetrabaena socialis]